MTTNLTSRDAVRLLVMALALGLTVLALAALACGPTAPVGQNTAPEPTATPTPTPAPTATPVPTQSGTPSPTPRLSNLARTMLALAERAAAQSEDGVTKAADASATPQLPSTIYVDVTVRAAHKDDFAKFLADNGATDIVSEGGPGLFPDGTPTTYAFEAQIPPALLGPITRQPGVRYAYTFGIYPKIVGSLGEYVTYYAAGEMTAAEVAEKLNGQVTQGYEEYVNEIVIVLESARGSPGVRAFLKKHKAPSFPRKEGETEILAAVPVPALADLSRLPGVRYIVREFEHGPRPVPGVMEPPEGSSRLSPALPGMQAPTPVPDREGARTHGALAWAAGHYGITGAGVKIGIIDAGFQGFTNVAVGQLPPKVFYKCRSHAMASLGLEAEEIATAKALHDYCMEKTTHGTRVTEAAYDVASGATYYISNLPMNEAYEWMKKQDVQIINHSIGYWWDGPGDGSAGPSNDTVKDAAANNILWVTSAGNAAGKPGLKRGAISAIPSNTRLDICASKGAIFATAYS